MLVEVSLKYNRKNSFQLIEEASYLKKKMKQPSVPVRRNKYSKVPLCGKFVEGFV